MRLLVISDTHGYLEAARRVVGAREGWDRVVHLGDSLLDAVELAADLGVDVAAVRGNNEYPGSPDYGDVLVFELGGTRFYAVHGHDPDLNPWSDGFDEGLCELARRASAAGAAVALFGHTHVALVREVGGVLLVNPGGMSAGDRKKTYAVVTVEAGKGPEVEIGTVELGAVP